MRRWLRGIDGVVNGVVEVGSCIPRRDWTNNCSLFSLPDSSLSSLDSSLFTSVSSPIPLEALVAVRAAFTATLDAEQGDYASENPFRSL